MNPLLPVLLLASAAGLLVGRRRGGLAWCAAGLAACALLAPALRLADGIPSPAASAAAHAPWQGVADPAAGNPHLQDVTFQIQPWLLFARHELRSGRLPLWNPSQSSGTPFWSNGQSAPLFPLHLLFALLPAQAGWLLLPWLRVVGGALGTWCLARELGLSRPAALSAALAFPLAGMPVGFLLFPLGNAVALAPWVLWSVERLASGRGGWPALAVTGGLQLLAGHPQTALHTALISGLYLLVRGSAPAVGARRSWLAWGAGWAVAGALAAVQLLPLAATLPASSRWQATGGGAELPLATLLALPLRLVLPDLFGNPAHGTWWGPFYWVSTAVYAGAATLPLAVAGVVAARRPGGGDRRWLAVVAVLLFATAAAYHLPGVRELLAAVPVVGRALPHRLLFAVDLALALLAGAGLDRWRAGGGRGVVAGAALVLALLGAAWWRFRGDWQAHGLAAAEAAWTAWVAVAALLLVASLALAPRRRLVLAWLLPAVVAVDLVAAHASFNPGLELGDLYPATGATRFLGGRPGRVAAGGQTLRPNAAMVYRLADIRGDDPVKSARYEALLEAAFGAGHPTYFVPLARWDARWLDRLGVRWIVTGPGEAAPVRAALAYDGRDARVWRRRGPLPLVRWARAPAGCTAAATRPAPARWEIDWHCDEAARLVVAESWDPGWRVRPASGRAVAVERAEGVLMGMVLGPGKGRVVLAYRPVGLAGGAALSAAAALLLVAALARGRRRRTGRAGSTPARSPASPDGRHE